MGTPRCRLESWKEIAQYVGRDVRTVMRWEHDRAFPVHRLPGGRGSTVFALPAEIDRWLRGDAPRLRTAARAALWLVPAVLIVALLAMTAMTRFPPDPLPHVSRVSFTGGRMIASADSGATVWTHAFGRRLGPMDVARAVAIADIDSDGQEEIIAAVAFDDRTAGRAAGDELFCFSHDGQERWHVSVDDRVGFSGGTYGPPWVGSFVLAYGPPSNRAIAWAVHHYTWWPSLVVRVAPGGFITDRFVHPGWLTLLSASPDGRRLFASGMSNAYDANVTAVLDGSGFGGGPPTPDDCEYACVGCETEGLNRYLVFPRTEVSVAGPFPLAATVAQVQPDGRLEVHVVQTPNEPEAGDVLYEWGGDLRPAGAAYSDAYWRWHARLHADGRLDHPASQCRRRTPPLPRVWARGMFQPADW